MIVFVLMGFLFSTGECKPTNAAEIFAQTDVDGGLIEGFLQAADFAAIVNGFE